MAKLILDSEGQNNYHEIDFDIVPSTQGPQGINIENLKTSGFVTLDPGFLATAQCQSKITYIDGDSSILRYRGYPIEQLVENSTFLEVAYLLIYGELPNKEQKEAFFSGVNHQTLVGEDFRSFLGTFPHDAHPMAMLSSAIAALGTYAKGTSSVDDVNSIEEATRKIIAKARTIVSFLHRRTKNEPLLYPNYSHGYIDDFIRMCFAVPYEKFESDPLIVEALDKLLILHADHEQNCSTTVVRITGSAKASLYSSIASGICALSGPLHGGANENALNQLIAIENYIEEHHKTVRDYVEEAKKDGKRLAGLGHRVYKSHDPRAQIAKKYAMKIYESSNQELKLFDIALELEKIVSEDEYFVSRKLYPNIDFWTGLVYQAIGFDKKMFTPIFALGRIPGWIAHWREMHQDKSFKIGRPRQIYTGEILRNFIPIENRN